MYKVTSRGFDELVDALDRIAMEEEFLKIAEPILMQHGSAVENRIKKDAPEYKGHEIHGKDLVKQGTIKRTRGKRKYPVGLHNYTHGPQWKQARGIWFQNWLTKNGSKTNKNFHWFQKTVDYVRKNVGPKLEGDINDGIQKFLDSLK